MLTYWIREQIRVLNTVTLPFSERDLLFHTEQIFRMLSRIGP